MELQTEVHLESVTALEVLPGPAGPRRWPDELKGKIVAESFLPGARVVDVARRYGVAANRLSTWRSLARGGKLAVPVDGEGVFAALELDGDGDASAISSGVEIAVDDLVIRLPADSTAEGIAVLVTALRRQR